MGISLSLDKSKLGKKTLYESTYNFDLLLPIPRAYKRVEIGIHSNILPFYGSDYWNHHEVSWLNPKGKPNVALARLVFDCDTPNLIESKSMKLYFNSFNNSKFSDDQVLTSLIKKDLEERVLSQVSVTLLALNHMNESKMYSSLEGDCIDHLDVQCCQYLTDPSLLVTENELVEETVFSHLLKSNCLVTGQPDWGSVQISYKGNKINHASLLQYIISFRNHTEFGEHCAERIFMDLFHHCKLQELTVEVQYTRRGGIDISSIRSTKKTPIDWVPKLLCR